MRGPETSLAPKAAPTPLGRDTALDTWRGTALVAIFVNHAGDSVLQRLTPLNFGFSDAAELFVLFAGYAAALAYLPRLRQGRVAVLRRRLLGRLGLLYAAHLGLIALALALALLPPARPDFAARLGLAPLLADPAGLALPVLGLGLQPHYLDILPLYLVLLALLPLLLWAAARRALAPLLGASAALWLAAGLGRVNLPAEGAQAGWFFNPLAWQLLFTLGFACGARRRGGHRLPWRPALWWAALALLLASPFALHLRGLPDPASLKLPALLVVPDKHYLSLPRLLHVLALCYVVAHSPLQGWAAGAAPARPAWLARLLRSAPARRLRDALARLGRNTLPVFVLGLALSLGGMALRPAAPGPLLDALWLGAGLGLQLALARWRDHRRARGRGAAVDATVTRPT
ncbi:OpgC domain-containing protein [Pseudoroseomonas cervicalis]|uniref:OpgC domain-containing protein n=1 Tax=Teichococcus cervicalis TaxID=204525 RepID=UPI0022F1DD0B|nr:OpgC domain-containing protein [Pseudoroseomonas cervicalis]WBV42128.1 OpgC domain-containing protein [Pseudoroseomonas cervicalis]